MKKLILTPQKDTLTICLPQEWVGKPLVCILRHPDEKSAYPLQSEFVSEVRESRIGYDVYRYKQKRRPRKKRLRKKKDNWYAVMHGAASSSANPSGVQGICPAGWHMPSDAEWTQLTTYVHDNGYQ